MRGNVKVYQKKIVDKRRKKLFFLCLWAFLAFGLAFSGLSYVSQLDSLSIDRVVIEGADRLDQSAIIETALSHLEGNYGYFFSKSNFILYPQDAIRNDIARLPLVKNVTVNDKKNVLIIRITERSESAIWCEIDGEASEACFSVDENGFIFAGTASAGGITYKGHIEGEGKIGSSVMPVDDFKNMQFFMRELIALDIEPAEVLIEEAGYMEIFLKKGGRLIINTSDDLSDALSNLSTLLSDAANVPNLEDFLGRLDYIRLDSGNKVFYKLK